MGWSWAGGWTLLFGEVMVLHAHCSCCQSLSSKEYKQLLKVSVWCSRLSVVCLSLCRQTTRTKLWAVLQHWEFVIVPQAPSCAKILLKHTSTLHTSSGRPSQTPHIWYDGVIKWWRMWHFFRKLYKWNTGVRLDTISQQGIYVKSNSNQRSHCYLINHINMKNITFCHLINLKGRNIMAEMITHTFYILLLFN